MRLFFGECVLDTDTRELLRGGRTVRLSPKGLDLLAALVEARPKALSKAEIAERVWPGTFVSSSGLGRLMAEVRAAIGDDADAPAFIRTVPRFGYAFSGAATEVGAAGASSAPAVVYRLVWGPREIELAPGANVLGREAGCAVWLDVPGVSRRHAQVVVRSDAAVLEDLGSKNGTYLRGRRIDAPTALADGDPIALGTALVTVRVLRAGGSTETVPTPAAGGPGGAG